MRDRRDRGTVRQRLGAAAMIGLSRVVAPFPTPLLHRLAWVAGAGWYLAARRDREIARANLLRVCRWLDERGIGSPRVRAAAHDPHALERLLRDAFGHRARYYLEVLMAARFDGDFVARHLRLRDRPDVERALGRPGPLILVGLHLGALEMPARYVTSFGRRVLAPMEVLPNPPLQAYLERSRTRSGVEIVPTRGSRPVLEAALAEGCAIGLIADREVSGPGIPVELFGAAARLPVGPALLALESHAPAYVGTAVRTGWGEYTARLVPLELPAQGTFRERVQAFLDELARTFERLIADAPEQWWSMFLPIWGPDASGKPAGTAADGPAADGPAGAEPRMDADAGESERAATPRVPGEARP